MAGDWLKVEHCTPEKPEVFQLADKFHLSRDDVCGKLIRVWRWFDQHLENGNATNVTQSQLDELVGLQGFANALVVVGWLSDVGGALKVINFERHLGKGAKSRALVNERVKRLRQRAQRNETVTREEKRREEEKEEIQGTAKATALALPDWMQGETLEAWKAWLEVRARIKAPNTLRALRMALAELVRLRMYGQEPRAVLEQATMRGYRGLFPVKPDDPALKQQAQSVQKSCAYCGKFSVGAVGGIWHCYAHGHDAMDGKPIPAGRTA